MNLSLICADIILLGDFYGPVSIRSAASEYIPLGGAVLFWNVPEQPNRRLVRRRCCGWRRGLSPGYYGAAFFDGRLENCFKTGIFEHFLSGAEFLDLMPFHALAWLR